MRNRFSSFAIAAFAAIGLAAAPTPAAAQILSAAAQMQTVDPNAAIDADLNTPAPQPSPDTSANSDINSDLATGDQQVSSGAQGSDAAAASSTGPVTGELGPTSDKTFKKDDLIGAAEGVFGKGAKGLAGLIEDILKKRGEPNAYIVGREASGALVVGLRYGSGTLYHKIEGEQPAYWTGPSIGFDAGANAGNTFVLVYNLFDSEDLYKRYPAGEGAAYLVGGFNASYLRRGDVVLIPIRVGVGARLGANVGYMKFRKKQSWLPF